ncbi:GDSL-type esterase/lipase family protein [Rummeliibacillus sp. JY-2-4R]
MKVVCFGDSITAGTEGQPKPMLTSMLEKQLPKHQFINAGVPGDTTVKAEKRLKQDVLIEKPDLVVIFFGANDSATHKLVPIEGYEENLRRFVNDIGAEKSILITPAPVDESLQPHRLNERIKLYGNSVKNIAKDTGSSIIDFFAELFERENYKELLVGTNNDGLHFGVSGYSILSKLIANEIKAIEERK